MTTPEQNTPSKPVAVKVDERSFDPSSAIGKKRVYVCDRCGLQMLEKSCKVVCPNCGNRFDCSDLNIYFD
jgi:rubrerythrin